MRIMLQIMIRILLETIKQALISLPSGASTLNCKQRPSEAEKDFVRVVAFPSAKGLSQRLEPPPPSPWRHSVPSPPCRHRQIRFPLYTRNRTLPHLPIPREKKKKKKKKTKNVPPLLTQTCFRRGLGGSRRQRGALPPDERLERGARVPAAREDGGVCKGGLLLRHSAFEQPSVALTVPNGRTASL